jgi:tetratricopeptide (TPR) repeat protein
MSSPRNKAAAAVAGFLLFVSTGRPGPPPDLLDRALSCLDIMAYDEAASLFEGILNDEYKRAGIRPYLAYAYDRLGNTHQAVLVLDTELRIRPEGLTSLSFMAFLHDKAGRFEEAVRFSRSFDAAFEKIKNKPKTRESALKTFGPNAGIPAFILGLAAAQKDDLESARAWFIKAWNLGYIPEACWIGSIDAEIRMENWAEALRLCLAEGNIAPVPVGNGTRGRKNAKSGQPKRLLAPSAEVFLRQGYIYDRLGKPAESLTALQTAAAMKPFDAQILKSLAIVHLERGEAKSAEKFLTRCLKLTPLDFEAMSLLEQAKSGRLRIVAEGGRSAPVPLGGDFIGGDRPRFRYVFHDDPDDIADKMNGYALRLVRDGSLPEAHRLLRSFTEIYENSPTIFFNLGLLANALDLRAEALEAAMRAIVLDDKVRDAYDLAANVCFKIRDFETSAAFYEEAVRLDREDPIGHYNLGLALIEKGEDNRADGHLREAVRLEKASPMGSGRAEAEENAIKRAVTITVEPISAPACHSLGILALKRGNEDEALSWFLQSIDFNPRNPAPYLKIGKLYLKRGEKLRAEEYFKKFLSVGGDESQLEILRMKKRPGADEIAQRRTKKWEPLRYIG